MYVGSTGIVSGQNAYECKVDTLKDAALDFLNAPTAGSTMNDVISQLNVLLQTHSGLGTGIMVKRKVVTISNRYPYNFLLLESTFTNNYVLQFPTAFGVYMQKWLTYFVQPHVYKFDHNGVIVLDNSDYSYSLKVTDCIVANPSASSHTIGVKSYKFNSGTLSAAEATVAMSDTSQQSMTLSYSAYGSTLAYEDVFPIITVTPNPDSAYLSDGQKQAVIDIAPQIVAPLSSLFVSR